MGASCSAPERACCSPTSSCQRTANHLAKDPERLALAIGHSLAKDSSVVRSLQNGEAAEADDGRQLEDASKAASREGDSPASQASTSTPPPQEALLVSIDERHRIAASSDESKHRRRKRRRQQQLERKRAEGLPGLPEYEDDEDDDDLGGDLYSGLESYDFDELGFSSADDMEEGPPFNQRAKTANGLSRTMTTSMSPSSGTAGKLGKVSSFAKAFSRQESTFHESGRRGAASGLPMLPGKRTLSRAMSKVHVPSTGLARAFSAGAGLARGMSGFVEGSRKSKQFSRSESVVYMSGVGVIRSGAAKLRRTFSRAKTRTSGDAGDSPEGAADGFTDIDDTTPQKPTDPFKRGMSIRLTNDSEGQGSG